MRGGRRPILADPMRRRSRPSRAVRLAVRAGAMATVGAAIALPLVRKRLRIPAPVTLAVSASGPLAVAVLAPRSGRRDVALFAMQMWAFTVVHEMPYDDPESLRRRLYTRYPIEVDTRIGARPAARGALADAARGPSRRRRARPLPDDHPLALVLRALRRPQLDPRPPPGALPACRPPDGGGVRRRRLRLLGGADRATLVGGRAGTDRGADAADHVRGRRTALGPPLGAPLRGARRQPLGGDALAPLRHLGAGAISLSEASRARARSAGPTR